MSSGVGQVSELESDAHHEAKSRAAKARREPRRRRFTREEYYRMADAGLFRDERVELIAGDVIRTSPPSPPHALAIRKINRLLTSVFSREYAVLCQLPLAVSPRSEPEPDFAVLLEEGSAGLDSHPNTAGLVIEVSETSLAADRRKAGLYAKAAVPDYWIVDLRHRRVEVRRQPERLAGRPHQHGYSAVFTFVEGQAVSPLLLPSVEIRVGDLLP